MSIEGAKQHLNKAADGMAVACADITDISNKYHSSSNELSGLHALAEDEVRPIFREASIDYERGVKLIRRALVIYKEKIFPNLAASGILHDEHNLAAQTALDVFRLKSELDYVADRTVLNLFRNEIFATIDQEVGDFAQTAHQIHQKIETDLLARDASLPVMLGALSAATVEMRALYDQLNE